MRYENSGNILNQRLLNNIGTCELSMWNAIFYAVQLSYELDLRD